MLPRLLVTVAVFIGSTLPIRIAAQDVTPDGGSLTAPANTPTNWAMFSVYNVMGFTQTVSLSCSASGAVTSCSVESSITLGVEETATVNVSYATGGAGSGVVTLSASGPGGDDQGWYNISVFVPDKVPASISSTPHNGENRDVGLCVAQCFDAVLGYATPPYFSMDTPRSVALVYRSSQADPWPVVQVDSRDDSPTPANKMSIGLKRPNGTWVNLVGGQTEVFYQRGAGDSRMAVQFDASGLATGAHDYTVVVRSWWTDGTVREATAPIKVLVINEKDSDFGWGWSIAGLERIYEDPNGPIVLTLGDGSIRFYALNTCSGTCWSYISPNGDFTTLSRRASWGDGLKWDRRHPDGTTATYRVDGRLAHIRDRFGNQTTFTYTGTPPRLSSITDPAGKQITFAYGADGKLDWIRDAGNRYSYVTIDAAFNLTGIQDPGTWYPLTATYDSRHRPTLRYDRRGSPWGTAYDFAGRIAADTTPTVTADGSSVRLVTQFRSAESAVVVDPASGYGTSGNPAPRMLPGDVRARVTTPRGYATTYQLDRLGPPLRVEQPRARVTTFTRNAHGLILSETSPSGHVVSFEWSGPNLTKTTDGATGRIVRMEYEPTYNQLTRRHGDVDSLWNEWSGGRLDSTRSRSVSRPVTKFTYDSRGRVLTRTDPGTHATTFAYSSADMQNQTSVTIAGRTTSYTYDVYGRPTTVTEPNNSSTQTTRYDELNRPTEQIGALSDTTRMTYDPLYLTGIRDAKGQLTQFARNALGWQESFTDPGGRIVRTSFDRAGNVVSTTNRRGQVVTFTYDALDQLTSRTADGRTTTFATDSLDRFAAASNSESVDTLKYDAAGRPAIEITVRGTRRYVRTTAFDIRDRRTGLSVSEPWTSSTGYRYNLMGVLDQITDVSGGQTTLGVDSENLLASVQVPTSLGLTVTRDHPSTHTPIAILYNNGTLHDSLSVQYSYTNMAQVYQRIAVGQSTPTEKVGREYAYDAANRLVSYNDYTETVEQNQCAGTEIIDDNGNPCIIPGSRTTSNLNVFAYDSVGNRRDSSAAIAPGNRLVQFKSDSMSYDADGNLIRRWRMGGGGPVYDYFWNSLGQLDSAQTNGVTVARFGYDGFGRRVRKSTATGTRTYVHDGHALLAELDADGNRIAEYTYYPGVDHPHSVRRWSGGTSATYYFATDHPGNVVGLIDGSNQLVDRYKYTPFGSSEGSRELVENSLRFGARELDTETGLYYNRARYYDASLGRFISEDPSGFSSGVNLYVYASNDPMNRRDPFGLSDDCSTIDVKVTEENGDVWYTQVTICKSGGSTMGQVLDFAATIGVGSGSYYWGGGVFATPAAIASHGGAGRPPCGGGFPVNLCPTLNAAFIHLERSDISQCNDLGQDANVALRNNRLRWDPNLRGAAAASDGTNVFLGPEAFRPRASWTHNQLVGAVAGSTSHEFAHMRYPGMNNRDHNFGQGDTPHDFIYRIGISCAGFDYL